jgi:two-component system CheB/CheR fusion protein
MSNFTLGWSPLRQLRRGVGTMFSFRDNEADARHLWPFALLVFALTLAGGIAGLAVPKLGGRLVLVLLPSGIAVGAIYRGGWRMTVAVFAAALGIEFWANAAVISAVFVATGLAFGTWLTATLLKRYAFDPSFSRSRDVPLFLAAAALGMVPAAGLGLLGHHLGDFPAPAGMSFAMMATRWWSNITAGVVLVAPVIMSFNRTTLRRYAENWGTACLWTLGVAACGLAILLVPDEIARPLIVLAANLWVVVGAFRLGLTAAAAGALVLSVTTACSFLFSVGVFAGFGELQGLVTIWSFSASMTGLSMIITALLSERDAAATERLRAEHRYSEIFDRSPHPMWVHHRGSGEFLLVNEAAVARYGWSRSEFLTKRVEDLAAPGQMRVMPDVGEDGAADASAIAAAAEAFETHHRTRDGVLFDVEVWTRPITLAGQAATLVFAADVTERRAFGRALIDAAAREQRRIGQEMHDGLGQELTGLALTARALATRAEREWPGRASELGELSKLAASCIQGARRIVQGLSPLSEADGSLEAALDALARRSSLSGTAVNFRSRVDEPIAIGLETRNHLYRIAQEAVQNAQKHAAASTIVIELATRAGKLRLAIVDDGRGGPAGGARGLGLGMRTMRFRANSIGGRLVVGAGRAGGYSVVCEVPQGDGRRETA